MTYKSEHIQKTKNGNKKEVNRLAIYCSEVTFRDSARNSAHTNIEIKDSRKRKFNLLSEERKIDQPSNCIQRYIRKDYNRDALSWYGDAIRKTNSNNRILAVYESDGEYMGAGGTINENGVFLTDQIAFSNTLNTGVSERLVLPDLDHFNQVGNIGVASIDNAGIPLAERCSLIAEHELIHLREAMKNTNAGGNRSLYSRNPHHSIQTLVQVRVKVGNIQSCVNLDIANSDRSAGVVAASTYLLERLQYAIRVAEAGVARGAMHNADVPTVIWELNSYLESPNLAEPVRSAFPRTTKMLSDINKELSAV